MQPGALRYALPAALGVQQRFHDDVSGDRCPGRHFRQVRDEPRPVHPVVAEGVPKHGESHADHNVGCGCGDRWLVRGRGLERPVRRAVRLDRHDVLAAGKLVYGFCGKARHAAGLDLGRDERACLPGAHFAREGRIQPLCSRLDAERHGDAPRARKADGRRHRCGEPAPCGFARK
jgi:hypothetical protein